MRIAVLHPALEKNGGAEHVIYHLCLGLDSKKHAVTFFTDRVGSKWGRDLDLSLLRAGADNDDPAVWQAVGARLAGVLGGYDVVLCHNYPSHIWYHYARAVKPDLPPAVYFLQEPPRHLYYELMHEGVPQDFYTRMPWWKRLAVPNWKDFMQKRLSGLRAELQQQDKAAVPGFARILVTSDYVGDWVRRLYGAVPSRISLGIRYQLKDHLAAGRMRYILCVARMELLKNIETLLRAFPDVQKLVPGMSLVLVGEGDDWRRLKWLRNELGLTRDVTFRGWVSVDELIWLYRRAMLFAFVPLCEPYGLVNLEAMAFGAPIVTSDVGGPAEVVTPEIGMRVPPLDAAALAAAMAQVLNDDTRRQAMTEAGYRRSREMNFVRTVDEVVDILTAVTQGT